MNTENPIAKLAEHMGDAPVPPMVGVGAIALQMAMQYHGITTIQDGGLYQALKADGKQIKELGLTDVFETAKRIELHLMGTSDRIAGIVLDAISDSVDVVAEAKKVYDEVLDKIQQGDSETLVAVTGYFTANRSEDVDDYKTAWRSLLAHLDDLDVAEDDVLVFAGDKCDEIGQGILVSIITQSM